MDQSNGSGIGGNLSLGGYGGKRVSLYIGQLTWVCSEHLWINSIYDLFSFSSGQQILI
jgi:hypothetical protein